MRKVKNIFSGQVKSKRKKMELKGKFKRKKKMTVFGRALPTKIYLTFPRPERSVGGGEKIFGHFGGKTAVKTLLIPTVFSSF